MHRPTPVMLVNPDGSERRRDDTDDMGAQQRRAPDLDAHLWKCWGHKDGAGAIFRTEVLGELDSLKKRSWLQAGGTAVLSAIGLAILGAWLSAQVRAAGDAAVKPKDVAAAVQKAADMATAKALDDANLYQKMLDQRAVDVSPLPGVRAAKMKGMRR